MVNIGKEGATTPDFPPFSVVLRLGEHLDRDDICRAHVAERAETRPSFTLIVL
jgi:hypothetical protein